jgi:hypothetical protein
MVVALLRYRETCVRRTLTDPFSGRFGIENLRGLHNAYALLTLNVSGLITANAPLIHAGQNRRVLHAHHRPHL